MEVTQKSTLEALVKLCRRTHEASQRHTANAVNKGLVIRNYLLGHHIVEFEQGGEDRAPYGATLLEDLSTRLSADIGRGFSVDSLEQMRRFYLTYGPADGAEISETPSRKLREGPALIPETVSRILPGSSKSQDFEHFWAASPIEKMSIPLSWSHYVALLAIKNADERSFYEIEAAANNWSLRELKRQINSSLYERLTLSRDQEQVKKLSQEGQIVESAADLIKNPYVLEFLDLEEKASYSEKDLETAIIDRLEHFLLELGKGFLFEARQKRFTFEEDHYYVDLVFYNRLLRCYTLIDLKIGELTHQDLGQMQIHPVRYKHVLRLRSSKPERPKFLRWIHEQPKATAQRAQRWESGIYKIETPGRTCLLRGMPQFSRRYQTREIPQDGMGQAIHQNSYPRLSHGVNVNYYDRHVKLKDENPTVGIILCKRKKDALVEITLPENANIHASEYQLYLPSKEEFKAQIDRAVETVEDHGREADQ